MSALTRQSIDRGEDYSRANLVKSALSKAAEKAPEGKPQSGVVIDGAPQRAADSFDTLRPMYAYEPLGEQSESFISLKEWDGYVSEVFADKVRGVMYPVGSNSGDTEEIVEIPIDYIDEAVREFIVEGSLFRLATGRLKRRRQIMHGTKIYFRRASRLRKAGGVEASLRMLFAD